jgi:hypothetical protein
MSFFPYEQNIIVDDREDIHILERGSKKGSKKKIKKDRIAEKCIGSPRAD